MVPFGGLLAPATTAHGRRSFRGVQVFIAASLAAGIYVLNHLGEGRWGGDEEAEVDPPSLPETPMVGQFLEPLDGTKELAQLRAGLERVKHHVGYPADDII